MTRKKLKELVIYEAPHPCPYLKDRTARLPMRLPSRSLTPKELDQRLSEGDRRHGPFLYRPNCWECQACEAFRIDVGEFEFTASHRRVLRKGDRALTIEQGELVADREHLALYNKHKWERGLYSSRSEEAIDLRGYEGFLTDRNVRSFELRYRFEGKLVAVAVTDHGAKALFALYCFWDPSFSHLSLGTYSILKQIELARQRNMQHLYLGTFNAGNKHLRYKARFVPHERLIGGTWQRFPKPEEQHGQ